jgi:Putative restriction endonuclease
MHQPSGSRHSVLVRRKDIRGGAEIRLSGGQGASHRSILNAHAAAVGQLHHLLSEAVCPKALVRMDARLTLSDRSDFTLDIAVLRPGATLDKSARVDVADVWVAVEVSCDEVTRDEGMAMLPIYAWRALPEVWLVDVVAQEIGLYCMPVAGEYAECVRMRELAPVELYALRGAVVDLCAFAYPLT